MANFERHLEIAAIVGGAASIVLLRSDVVATGGAVVLWSACCVGGILPDVDLGGSTAARNVFIGLGLICTLAAAIGLSSYNVLEIWAACVAVYLGVRYGLKKGLSKVAEHRGVFHSVLCGIFFWFIVTVSSYYVLGFTGLFSWVIGSFVFLGFMVHLVLDEVYSVDIEGFRIKRSFGTALKLVDRKEKWGSVVMAVLTVGLFFASPWIGPFVKFILDRETYHTIFAGFW